MSKHVTPIYSEADRARAARWVAEAPFGSTLTVDTPDTRSQQANALMWVWLHELARKLPWHGQKLSAEDYKDLLTASLRRELRTVPNTDGTGFVLLGMRTSRMTKAEMADLLSLIEAFAARHGVDLSRPEAPRTLGAAA